MEALDFESHDVGEAEAAVSRLYSRMRFGAAGESTHTRLRRRVMTPEVAFDDLHYSFAIDYAAAPQPYLVLSNVVANTVHRSGEGVEDSFGPGDSFLICRPGLPYNGTAEACRLQQLTLDPALLTRVATNTAEDTGPVRVLDHRPVSPQATLNLRRAFSYVRATVMNVPGPSDLMAGAAAQFLAASVLDAFPHTANAPAGPVDRRDASPTTVQRAVAFIDAHFGTDISLGDIAAAAYVTVRALQYAFRRHLDTTPLAYLRRVRLDAAHRDLEAADPADGRTVTTIAADWGFPHPGRFAALYREAYGVPPSRTLRG